MLAFLRQFAHSDNADLMNITVYNIIGYVIAPYIEPKSTCSSNIYFAQACWLTFNIVYLFCTFLYSRFGDCARQFQLNVVKTSVFQVAGHFLYPYVKTYPMVWWTFHVIYMLLMEDNFYIVIHPRSPGLAVIFLLMLRMFTLDERILRWLSGDYNVTAMFKRRNESKEKENENKVLILENKVLVLVNKIMKRKEELQQSLLEQSQKLKKWEDIFEEWSSLKAREMSKLVTEETNVEEKMSSYSRQRERVREEIARLETESKDLAKRIVESETNKNKLAKKRHKLEAHTDERLYEQKIEKAKILDNIQKIEFVLNKIQDNNDTINQCGEETNEMKVKRTQQLAKKIEEKERDLECPVCFEVCTRPIFRCHLSHQICSQCRPKIKVCPQCREPYKKHKLRHTVKETTSDQLELLYKNMRELLEKE